MTITRLSATNLKVAMNNLLKYFALRDDPHAQGEHQDYAKAMKLITAALFPWTMEAYEQRMAMA